MAVWLSVTGFGLGDLLKPDLVLPLLETLPVEERLSQYLPEVYIFFGYCYVLALSLQGSALYVLRIQGQQSRHDLLEVLQCPPFRQQVDAFTYVRTTLSYTPLAPSPPINLIFS